MAIEPNRPSASSDPGVGRAVDGLIRALAVMTLAAAREDAVALSDRDGGPSSSISRLAKAYYADITGDATDASNSGKP